MRKREETLASEIGELQRVARLEVFSELAGCRAVSQSSLLDVGTSAALAILGYLLAT